MRGPSGLSRAEREAIVVAVSGENRCQYCLTAHGAALRVIGKDSILAEQIANNWRTANVTPRLRRILRRNRRRDRHHALCRILRRGHLGHRHGSSVLRLSNRMAGLMDMRGNRPSWCEL